MSINNIILNRWALIGYIYFFAICLSSLFAQDLKDLGIIQGIVTDTKGVPLADVRITLSDSLQGKKFEIKTDENGNFFKRGLYPSTYEITYEKRGYRTAKGKIKIVFQQTADIKTVLEKIDPKIWVGKDFEIGNKLFSEGKYREAIELFQEIVEEVPDYTEAYYNLALCYLRLTELDKAIPHLEKVVELKPDFAPSYLALGQIYSAKGKAKEAIRYFAKAAELQPDNSRTYFKMGIAYCNMQKFDKAIEVLEKSINLDSSDAYSYYQLAIAYGKLENTEKMIENFEKFLEIEPDAPEASWIKSLITKAKGKLLKQKPKN